MSNIDLVHAAYVQRKVQEAERRRWTDVIKEEVEKIKGYKESDQTIPSNHNKTINDIVPPGTDLDNGEIFDIESGQPIGEL